MWFVQSKNRASKRHGFHFSKHRYFPIEHGCACRHLILGPDILWSTDSQAGFRVCTHDQNFAPLIICYKIATLLKINVPSCQINVPLCQINDPPSQINVPPSQINVPHCHINVPLSKKFPKFLSENHDPRDIYLQEGHIFVSLFDHVPGPLG